MGHNVQGRVFFVQTLHLSVPELARRAQRSGLRTSINHIHAAVDDCSGKAAPKNPSGAVLRGGGPASEAQAEPALGL